MTFEATAGDVKIISSNSGAKLCVWLPGQVHPRRFKALSPTTPERIHQWLVFNNIDTVDSEVAAGLADIDEYCERYRSEHIPSNDGTTSVDYSTASETIQSTIRLTPESVEVVLLKMAYDAIIEAAKSAGPRTHEKWAGEELSKVAQSLRHVINVFRAEDFFGGSLEYPGQETV